MLFKLSQTFEAWVSNPPHFNWELSVFLWIIISDTSNWLMILGCVQDREKVMPLMIRGFRDAAEEGGTSVTGGQTVINPWIIVGGVASVVCQPNEFIMWVYRRSRFPFSKRSWGKRSERKRVTRHIWKERRKCSHNSEGFMMKANRYEKPADWLVLSCWACIL